MSGREQFDPLREQREKERLEDAWAYCNLIQLALQKVGELRNNPNNAALQREAETLRQAVVHHSAHGGLPYRLRITMPPGANAHSSINMQVLEISPPEFIATEVRDITPAQAEFFNHHTHNWLISFDFQLDIEPLFDK